MGWICYGTKIAAMVGLISAIARAEGLRYVVRSTETCASVLLVDTSMDVSSEALAFLTARNRDLSDVQLTKYWDVYANRSLVDMGSKWGNVGFNPDSEQITLSLSKFAERSAGRDLFIVHEMAHVRASILKQFFLTEMEDEAPAFGDEYDFLRSRFPFPSNLEQFEREFLKWRRLSPYFLRPFDYVVDGRVRTIQLAEIDDLSAEQVEKLILDRGLDVESAGRMWDWRQEELIRRANVDFFDRARESLILSRDAYIEKHAFSKGYLIRNRLRSPQPSLPSRWRTKFQNLRFLPFAQKPGG